MHRMRAQSCICGIQVSRSRVGRRRWARPAERTTCNAKLDPIDISIPLNHDNNDSESAQQLKPLRFLAPCTFDDHNSGFTRCQNLKTWKECARDVVNGEKGGVIFALGALFPSKLRENLGVNCGHGHIKLQEVTSYGVFQISHVSPNSKLRVCPRSIHTLL